MIELLKLLIATFGGGIAVFIFFLYTFIRYPEKIERMISMILKFFAYISKKAEKKRITTYINSNLEIQRKKVDGTLRGCMPFELRIEFIDSENQEIYKQDNLLILKMKNHKNDSKNLAYAASYYVAKGLLPYSKQYLAKELSESIDYVVTKELIKKDVLAVDWLKKMCEKQLEEDIFSETLEKAEKVNDEGFLIRICLREYQKFGRLYPREPTQSVQQESKRFFNKVHEVVTKGRGEIVNSMFKGNHIKVTIVQVVARKKMSSGIARHHAFIGHCIREGYSNFYIISAGEHIGHATSLIDFITADRKLGLTEEFTDIYKGKFRGIDMKLLCSLVMRKAHE